MATGIEDLPGDVATMVLRQLDGPSLAAASCVSRHLRSLADQPSLWISLCTSSWPSLRHRFLEPLVSAAAKSFFSDAYSFPDGGPACSAVAAPPPTIFSAVDLFHKGKLIFSTVIETNTTSSWFSCSPFRVEALSRSEPVAALSPPISGEELTLSWIIVDPLRRRAVNLSSRRPVAVQRRRYAAATHVIFAAVLAGGMAVATVVVVCEAAAAQPPLEISLSVEDSDGICLSGEASMEVIASVLGGGRNDGGGGGATAAAYGEFVDRRRAGKEKTAAIERRLDLLCIISGISSFLFLFFFFLLQ